MKLRSIDEATNADLRGSFQALRRAAQCAREVAERTGTALVISRDGVIEYLTFPPVEANKNAAVDVQEPAVPYRDK